MTTADFEPPPRARIALSLSCAFVGWVAGMVWFVASDGARTGAGVEDFQALAGWSGMFVVAAWCLAFVPLVRRLDRDDVLHRLPVAPMFGAIAGIVLFAALMLPFGSSGLIAGRFGVQAALVGAVAWTLYTQLVGRRWLATQPTRAAWGCALAPFALAGAFALLVAPTIEWWAPSIAWRFGPPAMRQRVFARTLRDLRVGDSIDRLRRALPGKFDFETTRTTGQMGADLVYRLEFADGRITAVDVHRR